MESLRLEGTTAAAVAVAAKALVSGTLSDQLLPLLQGLRAEAQAQSHPMLLPMLRLYLATTRCALNIHRI